MNPRYSKPFHLSSYLLDTALETRKMLGRILKARLLIVGNNVAGRVEKHITLVATKEHDCADF